MAIRAIFRDRVVFPQEGPATIRMTRVAHLVHAVLDHQLRSVRPVGIVAIRTGHLSGQDGVRGDQMNLGALSLVTVEAHLGLGRLGQHAIVLSMDLMTGRAGHIAALMLAPHPIGALAILVTAEAGFGLQLGRCLRAVPEINVYRRARRGSLRVLDMCLTRSVTRLAARSPGIRLDSVRGLVNGQDRLRLGLIVAPGADPIPLESPVRLIRQRHCSGTNSQQEKKQERA